MSFYLYSGDSWNYTFTNSGNLEFFIADGSNMQKWNNYENAKLYNDLPTTTGSSGSFTAPHAQDWYLVWYNSATSGSPVKVDVSVNYKISSIDMSQANVAVLNTQVVNPNTLTVPTSGTYYFFIYFDPALSSANNVDISFTVTYHKNLTSNDSWKQSSPILTFLVIIIVVLLIIAIIQRSNAKKYEKNKKEQEAKGQTQSQTQVQTSVQQPSGSVGAIPRPSATVTNTSPYADSTSPPGTDTGKNRCHVCGNAYFETDVYCPNCGTKLIGRDYGVPTKTTPPGSENCAVCGTHLSPGSRFCPDCGTQVK